MISIKLIIAILIIHWLADFVLQTNEQAQNKSKSNKFLLQHTSSYALAWLIPACIILGKSALIFVGITFIAHTITDYFTSRLNSKLWSENKVHWFLYL